MTTARTALQWSIILVIIFSTIPFSITPAGYFIQDDVAIIRENQEIRDWQNIPQLFAQTYWHNMAKADLYRPLTITSYAIDTALWSTSGNPPPTWAIRATNIALHVACSLLVLFILWKITSLQFPAFAAASFFALHPIHTEAIVHHVGRADLLMTVFFLAAFYIYIRAIEARSISLQWSFCGAILYGCSMFSKEVGVMLLPLVVLWGFFNYRADSRRMTCRYLFSLLWPAIISLCFFLLLRGYAIGLTLNPQQWFAISGVNQFVAFSNPKHGEVLFTALHALSVSTFLSFIPLWHSADYSGFPHSLSFATGANISIAALVILLLISLWFLRRKNFLPLFLYVWFFACLLPVSNILFISGVIIAERALYLPSFACCAILGLLAGASLLRWQKLTLSIFAALLMVSAFVSAHRADLWKDAETIFTHTLNDGRYGGMIARDGLVAALIPQLERRPELIAPTLEMARKSVAQTTTTVNITQLATVLDHAGDIEESLQWWRNLYKAVPDNVVVYEGTQKQLLKVFNSMVDVNDFSHAKALAQFGISIAEKHGDIENKLQWDAATMRLSEARIRER